MSIPSSGSSTERSASITSSRVTGPAYRSIPEQPDFLAPLAGEEMDAVHEPDPVAARAHHERVRPGAVGEEPDSAQQIAVRDARRDDDHLAGGQIGRAHV